MERKQIVIAADDDVGLRNLRQSEEFVVARIAAGRGEIGGVDPGDGENSEVLMDQVHEFAPGLLIHVSIDFRAKKDFFELSESVNAGADFALIYGGQ